MGRGAVSVKEQITGCGIPLMFVALRIGAGRVEAGRHTVRCMLRPACPAAAADHPGVQQRGREHEDGPTSGNRQGQCSQAGTHVHSTVPWPVPPTLGRIVYLLCREKSARLEDLGAGRHSECGEHGRGDPGRTRA